MLLGIFLRSGPVPLPRMLARGGSEFSAPMNCKGLVAIDCMGDLNIV